MGSGGDFGLIFRSWRSEFASRDGGRNGERTQEIKKALSQGRCNIGTEHVNQDDTLTYEGRKVFEGTKVRGLNDGRGWVSEFFMKIFMRFLEVIGP
jgi:hypothetical protein